jgi:hypothetical protein
MSRSGRCRGWRQAQASRVSPPPRTGEQGFSSLASSASRRRLSHQGDTKAGLVDAIFDFVVAAVTSRFNLCSDAKASATPR